MALSRGPAGCAGSQILQARFQRPAHLLAGRPHPGSLIQVGRRRSSWSIGWRWPGAGSGRRARRPAAGKTRSRPGCGLQGLGLQAAGHHVREGAGVLGGVQQQLAQLPDGQAAAASPGQQGPRLLDERPGAGEGGGGFFCAGAGPGVVGVTSVAARQAASAATRATGWASPSTPSRKARASFSAGSMGWAPGRGGQQGKYNQRAEPHGSPGTLDA